MELTAIIIIILYIIIAIIAFKFLKSVVKALFFVGIILFITVAIFSFFIFRDIADIRANWQDSEKLLLLESSDQITTGMIDTLSGAGESVFLSSSQINSLQSSFSNNDLKSMLGDNYKMLIMDLDFIIDEVGEISFLEIPIGKSDATLIFNSDNPTDIIVDKLIETKGYAPEVKNDLKNQIEGDIGGDEKIKAVLFGQLIYELFTEKGGQSGLFIFQQYKEGNIIIYPETAVFKTIKYIPNFMIETAGKIAQKRGE